MRKLLFILLFFGFYSFIALFKPHFAFAYCARPGNGPTQSTTVYQNQYFSMTGGIAYYNFICSDYFSWSYPGLPSGMSASLFCIYNCYDQIQFSGSIATPGTYFWTAYATDSLGTGSESYSVTVLALPNCNVNSTGGGNCSTCFAPINTCSTNNGTQTCTYDQYSGGGSCNPTTYTQSCTINDCSAGYFCSAGGICSSPPTVILSPPSQSVVYNQSATLSWTATASSGTYISYCYASGGSPGWAGYKTVPLGSQSLGPLTTIGTTTYYIQCTDGNGQTSNLAAASITVTHTTPTVTLTPTSQTVNYNQTGSLSWSATAYDGATITSCTASGGSSGWSGSKSVPSGSQTLGPLITVGTTSYSIQCTDSYGSTTPIKTATITVNHTVPTVTLTATPLAISSLPGSTTLTWTSTSYDGTTITGCTASNTSGYSWSGAKAANNTTGDVVSNITKNTTFSITCTDSAGSVTTPSTQSVTVPAHTIPTATITANPTAINQGGSTNITWSSQAFDGATITGCTASSSPASTWSGSRGANSTGSGETVNNITASTIFSITCTDSYGYTSNAQSATVTIQANYLSLNPTMSCSGGILTVNWKSMGNPYWYYLPMISSSGYRNADGTFRTGPQSGPKGLQYQPSPGIAMTDQFTSFIITGHIYYLIIAVYDSSTFTYHYFPDPANAAPLSITCKPSISGYIYEDSGWQLCNTVTTNTYAMTLQDGTATNTVSGKYVFPNLSNGSYQVFLTLPQGYTLVKVTGDGTLLSPNGASVSISDADATANFCITRINRWFSVDYGDVRFTTLSDSVPSGYYASYIFSPVLSGPAVFFSSNNSSYFGQGNAPQKVDNEYSYKSDSQNSLGSLSYSFYKNKILQNGINSSNGYHDLSQSPYNCVSGNSCTLTSLPTGIYEMPGNLVIGSYTHLSGAHVVLLASGTMTFNSNINVLAGFNNLFIAASKGDMTITSGVSALYGLFSSENRIVLQSSANCPGFAPDTTLYVQGALIANALHPFATNGFGVIQNNRTLCASDATTPSLRVTARPDFLMQMTDFYKFISTTNYQETNP